MAAMLKESQHKNIIYRDIVFTMHVICSNMAAVYLSYKSKEIDCKPANV